MHQSESNFTVILNSSRVINLYEIHCSLTYAGLLEGLPNRRMNKDILSRLSEVANDKIYNSTNPYLIQPEEKKIHIEEGPTKSCNDQMVKEHGDDWELIEIPRIECIASFESGPITDDYMGSKLTVAWFQEEYPMPIDRNIINKIKLIDWNNKASSFDY